MKNNKLIQDLLAKAFLVVFAIFSLQVSAQTTAVSVFNYPGLNGGGGCGTENENLIGIISAIPTYTVDNSITSFSNATTLATQLDASEFFFMTDMETQNPSNTTFLPLASRDVIKNWVNDGGVMVMTGTFGTFDTDFLNLIFSWNLGTVSTSPWAKNTVNTAGTPFEGGPSTLPFVDATDAISRGTVPDFTAMYGTDANAAVAVIKYGAGSVIFMGYDFYDAGTSCGQYSSSWVQSIIPSSLNYARLLSSSVDNITYTSADVKYSFAQSGTTYYVLVPAGSTGPTDAQIEAGTNYSSVSIAVSGSSATTANVDHVFSLTGLVYNTSYDFYTVTKYNLGSGDVYSDIEQVNFSTLDNDIPVGTSIPNQPLLCKNTAIAPVSLTITDAYPGDNTFTVIGTSSNNSVVSDSNIVITGLGNSRSIAVTPNMNATGTSTISIRIQDSLLKESTVIFTVSFGDITKPTLTAVANRNENLDANCSFSIPDYTSLTTAADNCGTVTVTQSPLAGTIINNNGTVQMITLTANDGNGNFDSKTFNITLVDAIAPIVITKNIIVEISASGTASITASQLDNGTTDNCSTPILSIDKTIFTCEDLGANTVILRGTDAVGNFANQSATVTIVDNIDPVFTSVPQINVNTDLDACGAIVTYTKPIAIDNCAGQSNVLLIWDEINSNTTSLQNALIAAGNTVTLSATSETAYNGTNPALTGFDAVVHLNGTTYGTAMPIGGQNAILDFVLNQGKTYVTDEWSAYEADDAGTMAAMKEIIVLQRNSGFTASTTYSQVSSQASHPILAGVPTSFNLPVAGGNIGFARVYSSNQPIVLMTSSQGDAVAVREFSNGGKAIGFQNAGNFNGSTVLSDVNIQKLYSNAVSYGAIVQLTQIAGLASGSLFPVGTTTNTFTATDGSGNMSTTSFDVVVTDNQLPIIASNGDINVNTDVDTCGATVVVTATATDNCTVGLPAGVRSDGLALDALYPVGTTTIAWNVSDANSNAAVEVIQTVVVTDNQLPVLTSNGDKNVNTDLDTCGATVVVSATATDNCTVGLPAGVRSDGLALDALYPVGTTTIAWNVLDANSNAAVEVIQTVVVTDNQLPVIVSNGDKNVNTDLDTCGATVVVSATATDNCTVGLPTGVRSDGLALDAFYPVGTTTIAWNVLDANSNAAVEVIQTVVVTDNQVPVIVSNGDKNVNTDLDTCGATVVVSATATDNCTVGLPTGVRSDGLALDALYPVGTTTIAWNVADANNNNAVAVTQTIVVTDIQKPVALTKNITVQLNAAGNATIVAADVNNGSTDSCGIATLALDKTSFSCASVGPNTVTLTVTDNNGNVATQTAIVTVEDKMAPVVVTKNKTIQLNAAGTASIVVADVNNGSTDNCGISLVELDKMAFTCANVGANTVTLKVTDNNGNVATQTAIITVEDKIAPIVFTKNITVQLDASSNILIAAADVNNGSTDNCGISLLELDKALFSCADVGENVITLKVTDNSGNVATRTAIVTIVNSQPNLIRKHFDDVIFFDNSSKAFVSYSWYKNGVLVSGQTAQYFKDSGVLNGTYYAKATKTDGTVVTTCPLTFSASIVDEYLKIAPNPVKSNASYQILTNVDSAKLQNARITVFTILGVLVNDKMVDGITTDMIAPSTEGIYVVRMTLANGKYFTKNLLVKN